MRRIGVVTVGRSDYGILRPVLERLRATDGLCERLFVTGAHLAPDLGGTAGEIERDGFAIAARIQMLLASDEPEAVAKAIGVGVLGFAQAFAADRPDLLLLLGDRFETFTAAAAATPLRLPIAHLHGGELSHGAIDEGFRHAITKLAHLHFVSTADHARRVIQLGESPERVVISGAPGLDEVRRAPPLGREELAQRLGVALPEGFLLVTFHPATLEPEDPADQLAELLGALDDVGRPVLFTMPNADSGGRAIRTGIRDYCARREGAVWVENLGTPAYFGAMASAAAMVGNSSSGILEAASFRLPVVDVGSRQAGREHGANVLHAACRRQAVATAVRRALKPAFRESLSDLANPYGNGRAAERIVETLRTIRLDAALLGKRFHDLAPETPAKAGGAA